MFYFVRHGKTDYSARNTLIYQGFGVQLSPLSAEGIAQIERAARDERLAGARLILTSPYTRAVQSAAILSRALDAPVAVETALHEWLANRAYAYDADELAEASHAEYVQRGGCWPEGETRRWESARQMRERVLGVLRRYQGEGKVVIAGHGMMIQAVTGMARHPENGEIVAFDIVSRLKA